MFLVYSILILFGVLSALCYFEHAIPTPVKTTIYLLVGVILVGLATFREIGFDPDSINYEIYYNSSAMMVESAVEYSFIWISNVCRSVFGHIQSVFFIYALLGVGLKLIAFPKLGNKDELLMMLLVYLSYMYELHETTQIRTGVLSGMFLLAIPYIANGQWWKAAILILLGSTFHMSGLALLPLLFLKNKPFTHMSAWIWISLIPLSFLFSLINIPIDFTQDWGYIGDKIAGYQDSIGNALVANVLIYTPLHFFMIGIACYLMLFHERLTQVNPYFPILLKIYILALTIYATFSFFPVVGERISNLYEVVLIPLIPLMSYTIIPRSVGKTVSVVVCFVLLNYILRSMYNFVIFLAPLQTY